ncbi:hypothetical protein FIL92_00515 [SAR202 cluster bacterium AD-812-D07_MRT_10900m]|nr:hypothetical protein [SAR202 cluster bacterium AD-812-D07_MRT_10900m]
MTNVSSEEVKMNQTAGAIATPERPSRLDAPTPEHRLPDAGLQNNGLNAAWTRIVRGVTDRASSESSNITVDLAEGESALEFSTRLRMLLLFMNRETGSVSATVSPSFQNDTYPAMLALVNGFHRSGAGEDWRPDGPRAIRVGKASHLFVSVDMPVAGRSPSPDTLLEVVAAHRIDAAWYDQRVRPRASCPGLTTVMFGVPGVPGGRDSHGSIFAGSIFERERARNLSGRTGGFHLSRQSDWTATAAV